MISGAFLIFCPLLLGLCGLTRGIAELGLVGRLARLRARTRRRRAVVDEFGIEIRLRDAIGGWDEFAPHARDQVDALVRDFREACDGQHRRRAARLAEQGLAILVAPREVSAPA